MNINTDKLTTILGAIVAALLAAKPILDGSGYKLDEKTCFELSLGGLAAIFGYYTNKTNLKQ